MGQSIDMNARKAAEIRSYIRWLEAVFHAPTKHKMEYAISKHIKGWVMVLASAWQMHTVTQYPTSLVFIASKLVRLWSENRANEFTVVYMNEKFAGADQSRLDAICCHWLATDAAILKGVTKVSQEISNAETAFCGPQFHIQNLKIEQTVQR